MCKVHSRVLDKRRNMIRCGWIKKILPDDMNIKRKEMKAMFSV